MTPGHVPSSGPVLIVGGGGFLGTNLTEQLVGQGRPVMNCSRSWLTRPDSDLVQYIPAGPDIPALGALVRQASCVVHMAHGSSPNSSLQVMEQDLLDSMKLTFALMAACGDADVPLIYLSSGGAVYGVGAPEPIRESSLTRPISPYGAAKLTAENYLHLAALHRGLTYRVLRVSNPYGPWQLGHHGQGVIGTWMRRILEHKPIELWGDGSVVRDYIHVSDVTRAMLQVMQYDGPVNVFNIGSGEGHSLNDLLAYLDPICGPDLNIIRRPAAPSDVPVNILDITLAKTELNWQPTIELRTGLQETWHWISAYINGGQSG